MTLNPKPSLIKGYLGFSGFGLLRVGSLCVRYAS